MFVDNDKRSIALIHENLERAKVASSGHCITGTLPNGLIGLIGGRESSFDIVFADPPYQQVDFPALLDALQAGGVLAQEGCIIIEHDARQEPPLDRAGFQCVRNVRYGQTSLSFFS